MYELKKKLGETEKLQYVSDSYYGAKGPSSKEEIGGYEKRIDELLFQVILTRVSSFKVF